MCCLQNGTYLPGVQIESSQNLSDYTSIPFTDLQYHNDMTPSLGTCFVNGTASALGALMGQVNECASTHTFCCYATTADQVGPASASMLARLQLAAIESSGMQSSHIVQMGEATDHKLLVNAP